MTAPVAQPRRHWRIVRHLAGSLVLLVLVSVLGVLLLLRQLDTSLVKNRLRALVLREAGLDLDYRTARADIWTGLVLGDVTVASPPTYRAVAPTLLRARSLVLGWSLFSAGPTLRKVTARSVEITVVIDEKGHTSLESPEPGNKPETPTPAPGRELAALVNALPDFDRLSLGDLRLIVLTTRAGEIETTTRFDGVDFDLRSSGRGADRRVQIMLGTRTDPLRLSARHERQDGPGGEGRGQLWLAASVDEHAAELHGAATIERQSLSAAWPRAGVLFDIDARAHADGERLLVAVDGLDALGSALAVAGDAELAPDQLRVGKAHGVADLTRLARLVPAGLPLSLREGHVKYDVAGLELRPAPHLDPDGHLDLDGRAADLKLGTGDERLELDAARVTVKGRPLPDGGVQLAADVPAGVLTLAHQGARLVLLHAESALHATLSPKAPWRAEVRTRFDDLQLTTAARTLHATKGALDDRIEELTLDFHHPEMASGTVALAATMATLDATLSDRAVHASDVKLAVHARAVNGTPVALDLDAPVGRFGVTGRGAVWVPPGPLHAKARVDRIALDRTVPLFSTAQAHLELALADLTLVANVDKARDRASFDVELDAARAGLLTAFAPPSLGLPPRMALTVASHGRIDALAGAPRLKQHTTVHAERAAVTVADQTLAAPALDLSLDSDGNLRRVQGKATLAARALTLDEEKLGDGTLALAARWDADRPAFDLTVDGKGAALPTGQLSAAASFDRRRRVVDYRVSGDLGHLAALEPFLPASLTDTHWIDLSDLHARIDSHGQLGGVVVAVDQRGVPTLSPRALEHAVGDDELHLAFDSFHYVDAAGVELTVPAFAMTTHVHAEPGEQRRADVDVRIDRATLLARGHRIEVMSLHDVVHGSVAGDPVVGPLEVEHRLEVGKLTHDVAPLYGVGHVVQTTHARRGSDGGFVVDKFDLENGDGGTSLTMRGGLLLARAISHKRSLADAPPIGFSSLTAHYELKQALDKLRGDPGRFSGSGSIVVSGDLASGDLHRYHASCHIALHDAHAVLPLSHLQLVGLDGSVPIVEDFVVEHGKARLLPAESSNSYGELRFSDQHPFLSSSGALRAERIAIGDVTLSDFAGNLRIARSQIAVDQLDAAFRGGRLAGQLLVDWRGPQTTGQLRLRATGIEAVHGGQKERFDGNAALTVSLATRTVDGRVEILRIGRHHLYDLLDEYDPHHKDAPTNRLRTALGLGYPDRATVILDRGFASLSVAFGGLARLMKVHDVRGIPTGPIIERYLGPVLSLESP